MNYIKLRVKSLLHALKMLGIDPAQGVSFIRGVPFYLRDFVLLLRQRRVSKHDFKFGKLYPCLLDKYEDSGDFTGHYFHQDLLVARRIYENSPNVHVDIGSRVDGFVAHVAAFREIKVFDIRPLDDIRVRNISFVQADMMKPVKHEYIDYCDSISCLHALEHFGLGRYGDPVDFDGYLTGLENIGKMLKKNGTLFLSVPIGPQRIEFNAHRVFSIEFLLRYLSQSYEVIRLSYIDDSGFLHEDVSPEPLDIADNFGCNYGCGIFELIRK